jgi:lipoate-protein ligase A
MMTQARIAGSPPGVDTVADTGSENGADVSTPALLPEMQYDQALAHERAMLAAADGSPGMVWSLWQTGTCIVVPRSHTVRPGFEDAVVASAARGFPVHVRDTGGGAVVQGAGVVNLSMVFSIGPQVRERIGTSYRVLCEPVMAMLRARGIEGAFRSIPGTRKLAGTAQRWRNLGRGRPGEHAVLAHMALFSDLDHVTAAAAINALYADIGIDSGIEASTHINWAEIETRPGKTVAVALAEELDRACRVIDLEALLERLAKAQAAG